MGISKKINLKRILLKTGEGRGVRYHQVDTINDELYLFDLYILWQMRFFGRSLRYTEVFH